MCLNVLYYTSWRRERVPTAREFYLPRFPGEYVCQFRHLSLLRLAEEVDLETTQEDEVPLTTDFRGPPLAFRVTLPYGAGCPIRTGAALAGA